MDESSGTAGTGDANGRGAEPSGAHADTGGPDAGPRPGAGAGDDIRDSLPEELDVTRYVGPYQFPDIARRRIPGIIYLASGAVMVLVWLIRRGADPVLVNGGVAVGGLILMAIGVYHYALAGWHVEVTDTDALAAASAGVGFAVGHASAQLGWQGLRSRPVWRILLYSAEDPPTSRGLVLVDAVDSRVVGKLVEDNPEDWSGYQT